MVSYENKKVLVTGGAGFIGSHLAETLARQGAHVVILDDFSTGNLENIKHIAHSIELIQGDIRSYKDCLEASQDAYAIFHLGAFISVPGSFLDPELCIDVNVNGTEKVLDAAVKNKVKHVVFSSSAAVYGERNDICTEQDPLNPKSPYAKSKVEGEELCKQYAKVYKLSTVSLRYFNVYGERQNPESEYAAVFARFKKLLEEKQPLTVFGDGKQTRDFVEVSRVVEANLDMGQQDGMSGEVFNIATGNSINILELIEKIQNQLKVKHVGVNFMPARSGDIEHSRADCSKYQKFTSGIVDFPVRANPPKELNR